MLDLRILTDSNFDELLEYEKKIFKEYQFVDYSDYYEQRINFLKRFLS